MTARLATESGRLACAHAAARVGLDRHDHPCLRTSAEVRIRSAEVLPGDLVDVLCAALSRGRDNAAAHSEVAPGVVGINDVDRHVRLPGELSRPLWVARGVEQ